MKKFLLSLMILIILFVSSCMKPSKPIDDNNQNNQKNIISETIILDKKVKITYPKTDKQKINQFLSIEIASIKNKIIGNKEVLQLVIDYNVLDNKELVSFIFEIEIVYLTRIKKIKKIYNFDYEKELLLVIDDYDLREYYLPLINKKLGIIEPFINYYEVLSFPYIINNEEIAFLITDTFNDLYINIEKKNISQICVDKVSKQLKKQVVLTFDDGPSKKTPELLKLLRKYDIKASFFILGTKANLHPEFVLEIAKDNHEIGNHSYSHRDFSKASIDEIIFEITTSQQLIKNIIGYAPLLFRFPYGAFTNDILPFIDMPIILWNVDSNDWRNISYEEKMANIFNYIPDKAIIIFHDFDNMDLNLIEETIIRLNELDYEFVTCYEYFNFRNIENIIGGKLYR